jgi:hypothetical protein
MGLTLFSRLAKWAAKHDQFSQNGVFTRTEFQAPITPFLTAPKWALNVIRSLSISNNPIHKYLIKTNVREDLYSLP